MEFGLALRSRYHDADRCACIVDGQARSPDRVSVRTMNFGQHWRTPGIVDVGYRVEIPRAFFFDLLSRELPAYIEDCQQYPDPECSIDRVLRAADWPSAHEVMMRPDLTHFFAEWFAHDLLLHWFGGGPPKHQPGFVLNMIDRVETADVRVITIHGKGRATGIPVRYQDV